MENPRGGWEGKDTRCRNSGHKKGPSLPVGSLRVCKERQNSLAKSQDSVFSLQNNVPKPRGGLYKHSLFLGGTEHPLHPESCTIRTGVPAQQRGSCFLKQEGGF